MMILRSHITSCLLLLFILISSQISQAGITGICSNCHTMHNSQNGQVMTFDSSPGAYDALLRDTCIGCHSSATASTWQDPLTGAPIIYNSTEPTHGSNGLAGGNFFYVSTANDDKGHNVFSTNLDGVLGNIPPGGSDISSQIRCSGTYGCHGHNGRQSGDTSIDDETSAIRGSHHGSDLPMNGSLTEVSENYRFLLGIKGVEDSDWEQDVLATSHNEYNGSIVSATDTVSFLCAECHGDFHTWEGGASEVGTATPWLRHPTDIALKSTSEYAEYTAYSLLAPVARPAPDSVPNTSLVTPGTDIIMCLSCHRAHASPYFKMLRWDYKSSSSLTVALSGCNVCHTSKD